MREGGVDAVHVTIAITRSFVKWWPISNNGTAGLRLSPS